MSEHDTEQPTTPPEAVEPIEPQEAERILQQAIREHLGDDWDDEETGWRLVSSHAYMARLTRGRRNIDFYVDLLGEVTVEEKEISPAQETGRLFAWMLLLGSLLVALVLARIAGLL